jgi:hypothetical protein
LEKIERMDPKAVHSVATLKRWASEARAKLLGANDPGRVASWVDEDNFKEQLPKLAYALGGRNDFSLIPEIGKVVRDKGVKNVDAEYLGILAMYGTPKDLAFLLEEISKDGPKGKIAGCLWWAWIFKDESSHTPMAVRILVPLLDSCQVVSVGRREILCADESMEALEKLTGQSEGYKFNDPAERRFAAIDRWKAWWQKEGKADFVKKHPEVAAMFPDTATSHPTTGPSK